ncbi:hypothetical protein R3P38DRAFT_1045659 [Favolaschia claudopus]|uniref:Uncharacterized protein n=1 Tax=Favolaschia claudopus TaxID=2862362 RepID=A0AAW0BGN8_9AGAR
MSAALTASTTTQGVKRGSMTNCRKHYHHPIPVTHNGSWRWAFRCRYCPKTITIPRTVHAMSFEDEPQQPNLANLAMHLNCGDHGRGVSIPRASVSGPAHSITAASAQFMEEFLMNSHLGEFLSVFSAWILEDDLRFVAGAKSESSGVDENC